MDFLDPNNDCGQTILKLAASGSAIMSELLRLSSHIPEVFLFDSSTNISKKPQIGAQNNIVKQTMDGEAIDEKTAGLILKELGRYESILFGFEYLKAQEAFDQKI
jgi:WASH complex subunit strumpellin